MPQILDVCCGSRMFYFNKNNPEVVYCDIRQEKSILCDGRELIIKPDIQCDFRFLPFKDNQFSLVVFDPPHIENAGLLSWNTIKYGKLDKYTWRNDLRKGFFECWRVLKEHGSLIFKWNETQIYLKDVIKCFEPVKPVLGHTTTHNLKTHWLTFFKQNRPSVKL